MPRDSFDAPDNLPKQALCQVALGQMEHEVPGMANEAAAGLEQPLLQARQRPALDGARHDKPAEEIAEVIGDDLDQKPYLVGPKAVAGEPGPVGGFLALLDPLLRRPALVVEVDDGPARATRAGSNSPASGVTVAPWNSPRSWG